MPGRLRAPSRGHPPGAPGAVQVSDRWHLCTAWPRPSVKEVRAPACWARPARQSGKRDETTRERWQQVHDLLGEGRPAGLLAPPGPALNTVKRYARAGGPELLRLAPQYRPTLVDPYRDHLRNRRAASPVPSTPTGGDPRPRLHRQREPAGPLPQPGTRRARTAAPRPARPPGSCSAGPPASGLPARPRRPHRHLPRDDRLGRPGPGIPAILTPDRAARRSTVDQDRPRQRPAPPAHFAHGLEKDIQAATAALTLPYRNGPTEG